MKDDDREEQRKRFQMIGICATIPFVLAVPPILGWFIGFWLDRYFGTSPYIMFTLLILGCVAGIRELYRIVKKYVDKI